MKRFITGQCSQYPRVSFTVLVDFWETGKLDCLHCIYRIENLTDRIMKKKFQTFKLMKKQFGITLLVLLVLFSHPTAVETKKHNRKGNLDSTAASNNRHKWMDMMQATQSQQCHTLQPENRDTEDKLVLAPIVFQGKPNFSFLRTFVITPLELPLLLFLMLKSTLDHVVFKSILDLDGDFLIEKAAFQGVCHVTCLSLLFFSWVKMKFDKRFWLILTGRLISRSNVYNSLYFVSLRVQRVLKGSVPKRMHRHMRLLFHTDSPKHQRHRRIKAGSSGNSVSPCRPVTFEVKTGQKYAIYVKKVEMGRYVAVATPDTYTRKVRKAARKLLCQNCRKSSQHLLSRTVFEKCTKCRI